MLKKWTVENFKSIKGRIDLEFAPITIFAGSNSSGKSTILHSILLAKQTVRYAPIGRPLALNGAILKLGFFREIKHSASQEPHIGFGFTFDFTKTARFEVPDRRYQYLQNNFDNIALESKFEVSGTDDISQLHPVLKESSISGEYQESEMVGIDESGD